MKTQIFFLVVLSAAGGGGGIPSARASVDPDVLTIKARVFEITKHTQAKEPSFHYLATSKSVGDPKLGKKEFAGDFKSLDGKPAFTETISQTPDGFDEYHYIQHQIDEEGSIIRRNGKIEYTKISRKSTERKIEKGTETWTPEIQVGPLIVRFIENEYPKISNGETAKFRVAVPDLLDSVGFKAFKDGEEVIAGKTLIDIKMKPTSIFIAALVDPIHFFLDPKTKRIVKMRGRMPVKKKVDGDWGDIVGLTLFE